MTVAPFDIESGARRSAPKRHRRGYPEAAPASPAAAAELWGYAPVSKRRGLSTKIVSRSASVTPRSRSLGAKSVTM